MKNLMFIIGLAIMIAWLVVGTHLFLMAYANPEKRACVAIDNYNEADIEFWVLLLTFPCVLYTIYNIARTNLGNKNNG